MLVFCAISGLRWDVGVDHLGYLNSYEKALNGFPWYRDRGGLEEGYIITTELFASLRVHPTIYFAFLAGAQLFFILLAVKKEREILPYLLVLLILGGYFFTWMNGIRQMIAACILVYSAKYIVNRNIIKYVLFLTLAYFWHHSAIILILLFLLTFDKTIWTNKYLNIIILIFCIVLGLQPSWLNIMTSIEGLLITMGYSHYADNIESIADASSSTAFSYGPRMILNIITYLLIIWFYPKVRLKFSTSNIDIYYKIFFIGTCLYFLFANTNLLFLRPIMYLTIFALPMTAFTLVFLSKNSAKNRLSFIVLFVASLSFTYISCISDSRLPVLQRKSYLYQFYKFKY